MKELEKIVMQDEVWAANALATLESDHGLNDQVQRYGRQIIDCVVTDRLSVADLRKCSNWANELNRQMFDAIEHDGSEQQEWDEGDFTESFARTLLHGSLCYALHAVRTPSRLNTERVQYMRRKKDNWERSRLGMGRLEGKDLHPKRFDVQQGRVKLMKGTTNS